MPTYDQSGDETEAVDLELAEVMGIHRIVVRHADVIGYGVDGDELLRVSKASHPGAGLAVDIADHLLPG